MSQKYVLIFLIILIALITLHDCKKISKKVNKNVAKKNNNNRITKYIEYETRETNPPNFVRLLIMRLIYGIASQMGIEERLSGVFNGAFVPPGAEDDGDFLDFGGDIDGDVGDAGDLFDF